MCSASSWSSVIESGDAAAAAVAANDLGRQIARRDQFRPAARMTPRSTALRSSRMLPGQGYARIASRTVSVKPTSGLAVLPGEETQQVLGQRQNVGRPLAQRRHGHLDHVQAIEEVFAEAAGGDGSASRSRFVAARMRTLLARVCVSPTRS